MTSLRTWILRGKAELRDKIIKYVLKNPPSGDLWEWAIDNDCKISCVFIFYKRIALMDTILSCLESQNFPKKDFEVILVEDRGGSFEGRNLGEKFCHLNIFHFAPPDNWGKMGYMRNFGLSRAKGEIVLFLDDDTVITDESFLTNLYGLFSGDIDLMGVIPKGNASYCEVENRYSYHDEYFFTNRCMAYKRKCLIDLKGFDSNFIGQEDVEFSMRFIAKGFRYLKTGSLNYFHPPFIVNDTGKARAVGQSFARSKHTFFMKCLMLLNGARWLPLYLLPGVKNRFMARFGLGFTIGFLRGLVSKDNESNYS